jgi:hypothetical protein
MTLAASLYEVFQTESWDDLRTPATAIPIRGQAGDPDVEAEGTLLFDAGDAEQIALIFQMPHAWVHGSGVRLHVHWAKTTDAAGGVTWEEKHRIIRNGQVPGAWTDWAAATTRNQTIGADQKVLIDGWASITMTGCIGSDMLQTLIRRNPAATADTYAADVRMYEADIHYRVRGLGSEQEYPT